MGQLHTNPVGLSIAIIGGGIIGMSIAWRLAQAGFTVTVFEKSTIGGEASWAGAGMLSPGGEFDEDSEMARLAVESRDLYRHFVEELQRESKLEIDFQETGALDLAYSAAELTQLAARAERQAAIGIPSRPVSAEQIATFWPRVRKEELAGGYFYPGDASVNPRDVVTALRVACTNRGVKLIEKNEIHIVDPEAYGVTIIAAGAWSSSITIAGLPPLPPSEPIRGHLIGYRQPEQTCSTIIRHNHTYLLQRANGLLIVGASVEHAGFDRTINEAAVADLQAQAARVMPHLGETTPTEIWNGFRPGSDHLHIGPWHSPRVYLAYGHYRNGILLAPVTAQRITASLQTR
jgi:glycine oxidase